jgi:hypothetical protein
VVIIVFVVVVKVITLVVLVVLVVPIVLVELAVLVIFVAVMLVQLVMLTKSVERRRQASGIRGERKRVVRHEDEPNSRGVDFVTEDGSPGQPTDASLASGKSLVSTTVDLWTGCKVCVESSPAGSGLWIPSCELRLANGSGLETTTLLELAAGRLEPGTATLLELGTGLFES